MFIVYVDGMTCNHCANRVKEVFGELPGVKGVEVDLKEKKVSIDTAQNLKEEEVSRILEEQGYTLISMG